MSRVVVLVLVAVGLVLTPTAPASADEADVTAPQVRLNPCYDTSSCRRVRAEVFGDLQDGDDLAVLGARIGEKVLAEHVYDDGTGFVPHGSFYGYGNDVGTVVDYALSVSVPRGASELTFYARDLEGNTSELTTTVLGPVPPGPVALSVERRGVRQVRVTWRTPDLRGASVVTYRLSTAGRADRRCSNAPPSYDGCEMVYRRLASGWHRFTVRATTTGGTGPARSVRIFVPRA